MWLSIYLAIHISIHLFIHPHIHPSIYPSIHLAIYLSIYPSIHLSICPSIHSYPYLSIYLSNYPYQMQNIHMYIYIYIICTRINTHCHAHIYGFQRQIHGLIACIWNAQVYGVYVYVRSNAQLYIVCVRQSKHVFLHAHIVHIYMCTGHVCERWNVV